MPNCPVCQTPVDLNLSRRLERAEGLANRRFIEAKQQAFPETKASWTEVVGAYVMYDTPQSPITQSFGLGLFEMPTQEDFERIEKFFIDRGAPIFHEISPIPDQSLLGHLHQRGYYPVELTNLLFRTIDDTWTIDVNPALKVRKIELGEHEAFAQLCAQAWQLPPEFESFFQQWGKVNAMNKHVVCFVVEDLGKPVAGGSLCISDDVAINAGDCTLPEARGKGAQLALIAARLQYAKELGCNLLMMGAMPGSTSQKNGQRGGMHLAYTRIKWKKG